jgi:hypothetical protein
MSFLTKLKELDYFSRPFEVRFKDQAYFSTWIGFIFTSITLIFAFVITIKTGRQVFEKTKPVINSKKVNTFLAENYTLSSNEIPFAYSFSGSVEKLMDPNYYDLKIINYLNTKWTEPSGETKFLESQIKIDYELCGSNREKHLSIFNSQQQNFTDILDMNYFDQQICLKSGNYTIGGNYISSFFSNILIEISKCSNSTENNFSCKSSEEISKVTSNEYLSVKYIHSIPQPDNYTSPFQYVLDDYWITLDPNIFQHVDLYFNKIKLFSDNGFLFENISSMHAWQFSDSFHIYQMTPPPNVVARIYFGISRNSLEINREYMKIQALMAFIGGILKACIIVGLGITYYFDRFFIEELQINTFFNNPLSYNFSELANDQEARENSHYSFSKSAY